MKFGIISEHQIPKPWAEDAEHRVIWDTVEQVQRAEKAGFEYAWQVEHHFLPEFSHSSANDVFLAAVAQHTTKIRIGLGVALMPKGFSHPFKIAERAATLDHVSRGRLEFGMGRSITTQELIGFGINPEDAKPMLLEAARLIPQMWMNTVFPGHEGKYYQLPAREVVPKPFQKPSPPMWMASGSPESFAQAGRLGVGLLCFLLTDGNDLKPMIDVYKEEIAKCKDPINGRVNDHVAVFQTTHCAPTREEAEAIAGPSALFYGATLSQFFGDLTQYAGYEHYKRLLERAEMRKADDGPPSPDAPDPVRAFLDSGRALIGSPDDILERIDRLRNAGCDQIIMLKQFGTIPHEKILRSIDLIGQKVIPRAQEKSKAALATA
jgi:alkanesulfonate monooxygenase SsuD/methylene tetrahydromethanopterin reductase-like flavin-dependent oxidoreductase (luciferase family)